MRIIDLTLPIIQNHVRWKSEQTVSGDLSKGDLSQVTTLKVSCHSFTHVDAKRHFFVGAPTIDETPLGDLVGMADVVDLRHVGANTEIGADMLAAAHPDLKPGAMVILATGWHRHRSFETAEFWLDSPYLSREGAQWLLSREIRTVAYDFPQDYAIRLLLKGEVRPIEEHVTHDILLRNGVHMIEYLTNTAEIRRETVFFSAAPLKIPDADGAPARVYAIEDLGT